VIATCACCSRSAVTAPTSTPSNDPEVAEIEKQAIIEVDKQFGVQQAQQARVGLREVIAEVRAILASPQLESLMNIRDKHLAHNLTKTYREKHGPIEPKEPGYETKLLERSIPIVERLYLWVNGTSFPIYDSQNFDQENAEALWTGCKFTVRG
jgi:AbiU2